MDFLLLSQNFLEHIACVLAQVGAGKPCFYPYSEQLAAYERAVFLPEPLGELPERAVSRGFVFSLCKSDYHIRARNRSAGFAQAAHSGAERRGNHHGGFPVHSVVLTKRQKHRLSAVAAILKIVFRYISLCHVISPFRFSKIIPFAKAAVNKIILYNFVVFC